MKLANKNSIIKLENIRKIFKVKSQDVQVLRGINLEIKENDFNIIFGPSGCGKSTLLHIILGLEIPTSGKITFLGQDIYSYSEDDRSGFRKQHLGMIYQQPNWIKSLSVIENVAFADSISGNNRLDAKTKALEMLKLVGMSEWADYFPTELSSGQQQKVSLARSLITDPKIIIADEPTGNLDHKSGTDLMNLFAELVKKGKTVIMVTHDINMIDYANLVIQMFDGQVVKVHSFTKEKIASVKNDIINTVYTEEPSKPIKNTLDNIFPSHPARVGFKQKISQYKNNLKYYANSTSQVSSFLLVLVVYLIQQLFAFFSKIKFLPNFVKRYFIKISTFFTLNIFPKVDKARALTISRFDLVDLSMQNMRAKKTRTLITIGGMAIGVGLIVFLVSVGYGLEKMVISRVARLDEMKQIEVTPAISSNIRIDDKTLATFASIDKLHKVLPAISVVGKVNFQNSATDVVVYGVLADYLKESAIKPIYGQVFAENQLNNKVQSSDTQGSVAGEFHFNDVSYLDKLGDVEYQIEPDNYARVRSSPNKNAEVIGFTRRIERFSKAEEIFGKYYPDSEFGDIGNDLNDNKLGLWLKAKVPLWQQKNGQYEQILGVSGVPVEKVGYIAEINITVNRGLTTGSVLGVTTDPTAIPETKANNFVDISALEATPASEKIKKVTLPSDALHEAIVNLAFIKTLSMDENNSIGKTINLSFIVTNDLTDQQDKIISEPVAYTIVGITGDNQTPIIHVPIGDIKGMGVTSYSQVKVVTATTADLPLIRKKIEAMGFKTSSVVDTVSQIESLFYSLKLLLGILGVVALSVAALGMFNTLTVSLLERTREVGMMKAMGMKSMEIRDLFLTESMIMGLFGGLGGLGLGYISGKIISIILSGIALTKGLGVLDIAYIPVPFVIFIIVISVIVGILTGIYPSHRATKISALNALRYE